MTDELDATLRARSPVERLRAIRAAVSGRIVFTTSLGLEDQALTHLIVESGVDMEIATLDTGRLFPESYVVWRETEARYGLRIRALYPRHDALEALVAAQGVDGFYESVAARKACCGARKVEPLGRALAGAAGWVTGLRADQSAARGEARLAEANAQYGLVKFNPLIDWSREAVAAFVAAHRVPVNPLHDAGFLSIGCAPCTRAVAPGEPERAGRWWWEDETKKECGLHVDAEGRLRRAEPLAEGAAP
ncbi:MAG: phosphoadenylyl-sulfate reductase [Rhizobiales bacterium]|nr:phosphoadenylyl-sulfate reductase [Hyphomicrobiales bacterium]